LKLKINLSASVGVTQVSPSTARAVTWSLTNGKQRFNFILSPCFSSWLSISEHGGASNERSHLVGVFTARL